MFSFKKSNTKPEVPVIKMLPATAGVTYNIGDALVMSAGAAVKATGTTVPQYICAADYVAPEAGAEDIPAYLISPGHEYETTFSAAATAIKEGDKVTIHTDGAQVTATTTNGIVTVIKMHGNAAGDAVIVRF